MSLGQSSLQQKPKQQTAIRIASLHQLDETPELRRSAACRMGLFRRRPDPASDVSAGRPHRRPGAWSIRRRQDHRLCHGATGLPQRTAVPPLAYARGAAGVPQPQPRPAHEACPARRRHRPRLRADGTNFADWLSPLGIDVVLDRPGVGRNLQDHLQQRAIYKVSGVVRSTRHTTICCGAA